jgi:hypothetical protein
MLTFFRPFRKTGDALPTSVAITVRGSDDRVGSCSRSSGLSAKWRSSFCASAPRRACKPPVRVATRVGGRPKALDATKIAVIKALLAQGVLTVDEIAEQVGCATSTICRHLPGGRGSVAA